MNTPDPHITRLRNDIEAEVGRKIRTPKDFDFLSACIADRLHQTISISTLKRVWNYVASDTTPRLSTLDILAQFVGSKDWEDYTTKNTEPAETTENTEPAETTENTGISENTEINGIEQEYTKTSVFPKKIRVFWISLLSLTILILLGLWFFHSPYRGETEGGHIIHKGQTFAHYDDIHRLFGIQVRDDAPWYQSVPHNDGLFVWTPQYQNPNWHNEGDSALLFPTITEYWEPDSLKEDPKSQQLLQHMNSTGYFLALRMNDIRITFMQNLTDSGFVFLGVYRISLSESNTNHIVYERVADDCDLTRLGDLRQLRN
jgi:hypothetical protein